MQASILRQTQSVERMRSALVGRRKVTTGGNSPSAEFFHTVRPQTLVDQAVFACEAMPAAEIEHLASGAAETAGVPEALLRAVMKQESGFHPCAISSKGAMGLMQLMPATAADMRVKDVMDPGENVTGGAKFLRQLLDLYKGDMGMALSAYNAGPSNPRILQGLPLPSETVNYVGRVLAMYEQFRRTDLTSPLPAQEREPRDADE